MDIRSRGRRHQAWATPVPSNKELDVFCHRTLLLAGQTVAQNRDSTSSVPWISVPYF